MRVLSRKGLWCGLAGVALVIGCGANKNVAEEIATRPAPPPGVEPAPTAPTNEPPSKDGGVSSVDGSAPPCAATTTPPAPDPNAPAPEVTITIDGAVGPNGAPAPVQVDRKLYGMNVADWMPQDYSPAPNPSFLALLTALEPGVLRWPAGHRSQEYNWPTGGPGQSGDWTLTPDLVDTFIALAKQVGSEPLLAINMKRGTPAAAADLVRYVNVEKKYGVKYFQMGNEPDLTDGVVPSPEAYADQLATFADAMKAVDPSIQLVGPELLTGAHVGGINGTRDWMGPILTRVGSRFVGLSWHYYPLDSGQSSPTSSAVISFPHMFQETAADWPPAAMGFTNTIMPSLHALRDAHAPGAKVWITEIAEDPGPLAGQGISETLAAALWTADIYGRYAEYGPGAVLRWIYKTVAEHTYGILTSANEPRSTYGAIWMYARHFGDRFVKTETTALTEVAAHAAVRGDNALTVMLVNKTNAPKKVRVTPTRICPVTGATQLTLTGTELGTTSFTINGQALTSANVAGGIAPAPVTGSLWDVELPPLSARVVVYK